MQAAPALQDEARRLERLDRLRVMDTAAEAVLDRLTAFAAQITGHPIALVSLVDAHRQWWKSAVGLLPQGGQTAREISFCGHAIAQDALFEIEDARLDARFADNPLVTQAPHVVHYAGMPLKMPTGERIGTICVIDQQPGKLDAPSARVLEQLGQLVVDFLILRERDRDAVAAVEADRAARVHEQQLQTLADTMPQMLWSASAQGRGDYYNARWCAFTGIDRETAITRDMLELVHPQDRAEAAARWRHCVETGEPYECECRLRHASGEYRWVLARASPVTGADGRVERWVGTCTDVHDRWLAQAKLRDMDRQKDEFLAMLSHELRNPLAPIASGSVLLARSSDPAAARIGAVIARQALHLRALVDDLMDVSRVARGLIELHFEVLDARGVVQDALEQVEPLMQSRRHSLALDLGPGVAAVRGDRVRLTQVMANILSNAAKYTPAGGQIEVQLQATDTRVRIGVRDNGQGMDAALLPHVFDLFTQEVRSLDRTTGGLGLGLALVKRLVELHGGTVTAASEGRGRGASFVVELPRAPATPG